MSVATSSTLTQEFVDQLSQELLIEPDPQWVFALLAGAARAGALGIPEMMGPSGAVANMEQAMSGGMGTLRLLDQRWMSVAGSFCKVVSEPTTPGKVILIDRPAFLDSGLFTEASRRLVEATPVSATPQAPTMGQATVTIREYAGPHDGSNVAPIGVTDFLKRRARHDMISYVGGLLRRDRNKWVDRAILEQLLSTSHATDGADDAPFTEDMMSAILRKLQERNVPTFANGMYMLVISPIHLQDLKGDEKFRESVRYLGEQGALIQGHVANHGGFMVVVSNNIPSATVDDQTAYQAVAFGPESVGWAIGLDAEARRSKDDDFGREDRVLWLAHEGWALLNEAFVEKVATFVAIPTS